MTALAAAPGSQIVRMDEQGDITREPCVGFYHVQGSIVFSLSISGGQMNARSAVMTSTSAEYEDGLVSYPHGKLTFASMSEWIAYMEAVDPQVDDEPTEAEMAGGGGVDDVIGKAAPAPAPAPTRERLGDPADPWAFGTKTQKQKSYWHAADQILEVAGGDPLPVNATKIKRDEYAAYKRDGVALYVPAVEGDDDDGMDLV